MLSKIVERRNLSFEEAYELYNEIVKESPVRIAAYLSALQTKGFTAEELAGFAKAMRDSAIKIELGEVCDTCGTGGDGASTINVSTASAIIISMFGKVAKHGNKSVTSKSGSANVLEAFGIKINLNPEEAKKMIEKTNFAFLFAPLYHPPLKNVMDVRRELKIRTIFNVLGPLANPANPAYQLVGVFSENLVERVAEAMEFLGVKKGVVVHGNGLDEVSPRKETIVAEVNKNVETYKLTPEDFGVKRTKIVPCNSPEESAKRIAAVLSGRGLEEDRTFVLLNASMALYSSDFGELKDCVEAVRNILDEGSALKKLEEIVDASKKN
ncbi:anthranilate phosphoribosyltransferase [Ferroglobus placidus DSM 10642]|uniref:Anthranilate phosphoribosyltransferase n=1 Tax=Ferroglobus placidus (strain DSM 10642 / AEDII12DO) TaxID=589924 RepID=D3S069_FERPA|nr:anthranilate phosphoribosyltransferase [Ferroglobus placidus]ADC66132.1 anthranilate phosphoribosyltransferase [Ferroglobus placidus DSM 10642]